LQFSELVSLEGEAMVLKTSRTGIPNCIAEAMQKFHVLDIEVEEEDIGSVIEAIMRTGNLAA